jgi:hypothetical protein
MKHILRVAVVSVFLVAICFTASSVLAKNAHAATRLSTHPQCHVAKYLTDSNFIFPEGAIDVTLYYDECTLSNYAGVSLTPQVSLSGQAYVERAAGPDGGIAQKWSNTCSVHAPSGLTCYSPQLYSPHNPAQACWLESGYDYSFCTSFI